MYRTRIAFASAILVLISAASFPAAQQQADDQVTVPLSDPSRPGVINVSLVQGSITVRGSNRKDVLVIAHPEAERPSRRVDPDAAGLRRIPQSTGYRVEEESNR